MRSQKMMKKSNMNRLMSTVAESCVLNCRESLKWLFSEVLLGSNKVRWLSNVENQVYLLTTTLWFKLVITKDYVVLTVGIKHDKNSKKH